MGVLGGNIPIPSLHFILVPMVRLKIAFRLSANSVAVAFAVALVVSAIVSEDADDKDGKGEDEVNHRNSPRKSGR